MFLLLIIWGLMEVCCASSNPVLESVVSIETSWLGEPQIIGTGSYVRLPNGRYSILTARHVSRDTNDFNTRACFITDRCIKLGPYISGEEDPEYDWANDWAVYLLPDKIKGIPYLTIASKELDIAEPVSSYGYGWGNLRVLVGINSLVQPPTNVYVLQMRAAKGLSGGPVLNKKGQVACIIMGYLKEPHEKFKDLYLPTDRTICTRLGQLSKIQ